MNLAPYAAHPEKSRGRRYLESPPAYRTDYQRDRDRIIHSAAFRRLMYKTQVFVNHEGDHFRTRLTHSLEVAQIGRTIARSLALNEDLAEAIALAHDLGHTPFGHAGQEALDACMASFGGFEHNLQSLRVVDALEERYAAFPGLNLTFETREGILKHCSGAKARALGDVGKRFLEGTQPGLEAQVINLADAIAYNSHDIDDGLRAGLLTVEALETQDLFQDPYLEVLREHPKLAKRQVIHEVVRRIIHRQVVDLIEHSRRLIQEAAPADIEAVRKSPPLIAFSPAMETAHRALKRFLMDNLYRHYRVHRMNIKAKGVVKALFGAFFQDPRLLPESFGAKARDKDEAGRARVVADYIAGMTDRYALLEHARLFEPQSLT